MFGYIIPCAPELKVRELEVYRRYYCGLCHELHTQFKKRSALNFDATFIYLLADALQGDTADVERCSCPVHPGKGVEAVCAGSAGRAACVNVLMAWAKAEDDVRDGGGLRSRLMTFAYGRVARKARRLSRDLYEKTVACAAQIHANEESGCASVDRAAEPYGVLFGDILSDLDLMQSHILFDLGYNIGRWVYLIDAWDDLSADEKHGHYNVFAAARSEEGCSLDDLRENARFSMHFTLSRAADALERLQVKHYREILSNIVRLGLYTQTQSVLAGRGRICHESLRSSGRT